MADTAALNQAYFNKIADDYDSRFEKTLRQVQVELMEEIDFLGIKKDGRLLDYACGTGLLSRSLGDHVQQCVGVDVSESMVGAFNVKAQTQNISPERRYAYLGNLIDPGNPAGPPALSGPEFYNFDAAGVGAGFHHFDDCILAASRLVDRLTPGGTLFILDFMPHDANPSHAAHGVRHHGFSEETIQDVFNKAGAGKDFAYKPLNSEVLFGSTTHGVAHEMQRHFFLARGTKA